MKSVAPALTLFLLAPLAAAQDYLPPRESVEAALAAHPMRQAAAGELAAARSEARRQAAGEYEWTLEGSYSSRDISKEGRFDEFEVAASRPLRRPGKAALDRALGEAGFDSAEQRAAMARRSLALDLATLWMDWLAAEDLARLQADRVANLARAQEAARGQQRAGSGATIDVELAASALAAARADLEQARGDADMAAASLDARFPELARPPRAPEPRAPQPLEDVIVGPRDMASRDPELAYLDAEVRRLAVQARRARANLRPDPEVGVRAFSERGGDELGAGLFVAIPIGGAARSAASDRDTALAAAIGHQAAALRRTKEAEARQAIIAAEAAFQAWKTVNGARRDSQTVIERMRRGFELGAYDLPALLVGEARHWEVIRAEAEARMRAHRARLRLRVMSGDLWADDMGATPR